MKLRTLVSCSLLGLAVALAGCQTSGSDFKVDRKMVDGLPSVTATNSAWADVKVEAIDYDNRTIALAGSDGKSEIFTVGKEARNFDQIKKGDTVHVEYAEQLTANIRKKDEPLGTDLTAGIARAPKGDKPGFMAFRTVETDTTITGLDYATRVATFKDTTGHTFSIKASDKLKGLDKVKVGDQVVFTYTEVLQISVTK